MEIQMLNDNKTGKTSMMRIAVLIMVFPIILIFIIHNIVAMFGDNNFISMGWPEISALGLVFSAKAAQKFGEKNVDNK